MVAILAIMVILLAVLALVVVTRSRDSPWGLFTIACTIPIALLMGFWMKSGVRAGRWRPRRSAWSCCSLALVGGRWVAASPSLAPLFTWSGTPLAWAMIGYGFVASVLPVWMLLCPRDYLSTFMKIGDDRAAGRRHHPGACPRCRCRR